METHWKDVKFNLPEDNEEKLLFTSNGFEIGYCDWNIDCEDYGEPDSINREWWIYDDKRNDVLFWSELPDKPIAY